MILVPLEAEMRKQLPIARGEKVLKPKLSALLSTHILELPLKIRMCYYHSLKYKYIMLHTSLKITQLFARSSVYILISTNSQHEWGNCSSILKQWQLQRPGRVIKVINMCDVKKYDKVVSTTKNQCLDQAAVWGKQWNQRPLPEREGKKKTGTAVL